MKKLILLLALLIPMQADAKLISMGECKITYYCACSECSGPWGDLTATGTRCEEGRTVAVDPDTIDIGSKVKIGDHIYTAEDVGPAVVGDTIDIFFDTHEEVDAFGVQYKLCWVVKDD